MLLVSLAPELLYVCARYIFMLPELLRRISHSDDNLEKFFYDTDRMNNKQASESYGSVMISLQTTLTVVP